MFDFIFKIYSLIYSKTLRKVITIETATTEITKEKPEEKKQRRGWGLNTVNGNESRGKRL